MANEQVNVDLEKHRYKIKSGNSHVKTSITKINNGDLCGEGPGIRAESGAVLDNEILDWGIVVTARCPDHRRLVLSALFYPHLVGGIWLSWKTGSGYDNMKEVG